MARTRKTNPNPEPSDDDGAGATPSSGGELIRGKYNPEQFPQLLQFPDIDPGMNWPEGRALPEGFRLDRSGRIWPVPVRKGRKINPALQCVGMNKTDEGEVRCNNYAMKGRTTCRMHGGAERAGIEHPNVKTGEHTRHGIFGDCGLPPELSEWYARAIEDPAIYDLTHNIAILAGRERELLGGLSTGEARASWKKAQEITEELYQAARANDKEKIAELLPELRAITKAGRNDTEVWKEVQNIGERKRRLVESERKRRLDMKMVVSADQLRGLLRAFSQIVFEEVNNIPAIAATLYRNEGKLETGRIAQAVKHRIGYRMGVVCQGMQAGRLPDIIG